MKANPKNESPGAIEGLIARLLFWGGLLSVATLVIGMALYLKRSDFKLYTIGLEKQFSAVHGTEAAEAINSISDVISGLEQRPVDPLAVIGAGLVLLLMTPVLAVALSIPAFIRARDYRYAMISIVVLGILLLSFVIGGSEG